jgi:hypothetical protein
MTSSTETTNRCMVNMVEEDDSEVLGDCGVVQEGRTLDTKRGEEGGRSEEGALFRIGVDYTSAVLCNH